MASAGGNQRALTNTLADRPFGSLVGWEVAMLILDDDLATDCRLITSSGSTVVGGPLGASAEWLCCWRLADSSTANSPMTSL